MRDTVRVRRYINLGVAAAGNNILTRMTSKKEKLNNSSHTNIPTNSTRTCLLPMMAKKRLTAAMLAILFHLHLPNLVNGWCSQTELSFKLRRLTRCTPLSVSYSDEYIQLQASSTSLTATLPKMIHWRGEKSHGNSLNFRQLEFTSAFESSVLDGRDIVDPNFDIVSASVKFSPSLSSNFEAAKEMTNYEVHAYENALQYVSIHNYEADNNLTDMITNNDVLIRSVKRCSLIRSLFEIVADGETFEDLAHNTIMSGNLDDMMQGGKNSESTWAVRLRQYGSSSKLEKQAQYGKKMRSPMSQEIAAIDEMKDLFIKFTGAVDLKDADINLYLFEGLGGEKYNGRKVIARLMTRGANTSSIAPKTRICVTNTPLCPLAAYTMCNVARIRPGLRILDPYAGSCAILLAAAMIEPSVKSVGIEIAHNGQVNRDDIMKDFESRNLALPAAIIRGDSSQAMVRREAMESVGNKPFDLIITDPPYGIREKTGFCVDPPLVSVVKCISEDRRNGNRLLKKGGRLVAFVPNQHGDDIQLDMPSDADLQKAGLRFCQMLEQPLNDSLSRWLVEYLCIE